MKKSGNGSRVSSLVERLLFGDDDRSQAVSVLKLLSENIQDEELALLQRFNGK
jgi:tRNA-(ms[2]io[6]A)-hydroxylase